MPISGAGSAAAADSVAALVAALNAASVTSLQKSNNLSDVTSASASRTSLGLGAAATMTTAQIAADTALTGAFASKALLQAATSLAPGWSIVSDRGNGLQHVGSDGIATDMMAEQQHYILRDVSDLRLLYVNMANASATDGTGQPGNGWNAITVNAAVATGHLASGNKRHQVTFGGRTSVTIDSGGFAISDPIGVTWTAGTVLWERVHVTVASAGMKWPTGTGSDYLETGTSANDKTLTGDLTGSGNKAYSATAVLGRTARAGQFSLVISGDSWSSSGADWGANSATGFPSMNLARTGESQVTANDAQTYRRRWQLVSLGTHVENCYGVNDFQQWSGTFSLATLQATYITRWRQWAARGMVVHQWTATPKTTSTDSWATTGNQTNGYTNAVGVEAGRTAYNDWLRDGAPLNPTTFAPVATGTATGATVIRTGSSGHPLAAVVEIADIAETSRNSGIWKAGNTSDGVHPNSTGNATLQAFRLTYWNAVKAAYDATV